MIDSTSTERLIGEHVSRLVARQLDGSGTVGNQIASRMHRGDDLELLRPMFEAGDVECARSLVFVLSEIGTRSAQAMVWLDALVDFPDDYVQHYAIVAIQHSGSLEHGDIAARAISKLGQRRAVSLAAVKFLAFGSPLQLATAVPFLEPKLRDAVQLLLTGEVEGCARLLASSNIALALVAVASARRHGQSGSDVLDLGTQDEREEVAFAARYVQRLAPLPLGSNGLLSRIEADNS